MPLPSFDIVGVAESERVTVSLVNQDEWDRLPKNHEIKVDNTIKPYLVYDVRGLKLTEQYTMILYMQHVESRMHDYCAELNGIVLSYQPTNAERLTDFARHRYNSVNGFTWMSKPFVFDNVKLTKNMASAETDLIRVKTFHMYRPTLAILKFTNGGFKRVGSYTSPNTEFVAVDEYQRETTNPTA